MSHIEVASVPCGSCSLCCRHDAVPVLAEEGDDVASYDVTYLGDMPILKKGADNNCGYLVQGACSIYHRRPHICRIFDCRRAYLAKTRQERRALVKRGMADKAIYDRGRELVPTLPVHFRP